MRVLITIGAFTLAATALSGCMLTTEDKELDGITLGAGDAIAINSALQIIDPWPAGVQDTDLKVPAKRDSKAPASDGTAGGITTGDTPAAS